MLSATDRIGDFGLAVVSKQIQKELTSLTSVASSFCSVLIREKSQYRLFAYTAAVKKESASGILGVQLASDTTSQMQWGELRGIKAYVADSDYSDTEELVVFSNEEGHVFRMEDGATFDGSNINASFYTPFVPVADPRVRKTFYKMVLYTDPQGSVTTIFNMKLDFDTLGSIQPTSINLSNSTGTVGFYGAVTARYGITRYGRKLKRVFETQVIGSGFSVSLQFESNSNDPSFSLDAATLEYIINERR